MINTILTDLFEKWNTEKKCGKCWVFVKTFNDHIKGTTNLYSAKGCDKCCVHIFLEGLTIKSNKKINDLTGIAKVTHCDYYLHFKIMEQSDFQMQKGTEIMNDIGIFDKHINPLIECISCSFEDDLCSMFEGSNGVVFNEETKPFFSYGDSNWSGLDYRLTIREYKA